MTEPSRIDTARLFDLTAFVTQHTALLDLLDDRAPDAEIDAQLERLLQCMRQQFAAEVQAMQATNFHATAAHKKHHDHALDKLAQRIVQWQQGRDRKALQDYAENELAEWFVSHVNIRDFVTARHIAMQQANGH
jgi:hemerythrin